MLGFHSEEAGYSPSPFHFARMGRWDIVYEMLRHIPALTMAVDAENFTGWSWLDHALYQRRIDVMYKLKNEFHLHTFFNKNLILSHACHQEWRWIHQLLEIKLISINDEYYFQDNKTYTLLDIAYMQKKKKMIATLRQYGALSKQELDIANATKQMFSAAKTANWQIVYQLLDQKQANVDNINSDDPDGRVLLHFAYEQRNQRVFLKLLDHYGASLDEIRNTDPILYQLMIDFYDYCQYSLKPSPIVRSILPSYGRAQQTVQSLTKSGLGQLKADYPNVKDEVYIPPRRTPW